MQRKEGQVTDSNTYLVSVRVKAKDAHAAHAGVGVILRTDANLESVRGLPFLFSVRLDWESLKTTPLAVYRYDEEGELIVRLREFLSDVAEKYLKMKVEADEAMIGRDSYDFKELQAWGEEAVRLAHNFGLRHVYGGGKGGEA